MAGDFCGRSGLPHLGVVLVLSCVDVMHEKSEKGVDSKLYDVFLEGLQDPLIQIPIPTISNTVCLTLKLKSRRSLHLVEISLIEIIKHTIQDVDAKMLRCCDCGWKANPLDYYG